MADPDDPPADQDIADPASAAAERLERALERIAAAAQAPRLAAPAAVAPAASLDVLPDVARRLDTVIAELRACLGRG